LSIKNIFIKNDFDSLTNKEILWEDLSILYNPKYSSGNLLTNLSNSDLLKSVLKRNCGIMKNQYDNLTKIENLMPFLNIACFIEKPIFLNEIMDICTKYLQKISMENQVFFKHESMSFIRILTFHFTKISYKQITLEIIIKLRNLMTISQFLKENIINLLILSINCWINCDLEIYLKIWNIINCVYFQIENPKIPINTEILLEILKNIDQNENLKPCCENNLKTKYQPFYEFLTKFIIKYNKYEIEKIIFAINLPTLSHCLFLTLGNFMQDLLKKDINLAKSFINFNGNLIIFKACTNLPIDCKILALSILSQTLIFQSTNQKFRNSNPLQNIEPAFVSFKRIRDFANFNNSVQSPKNTKKRSMSVKRIKFRLSEPYVKQQENSNNFNKVKSLQENRSKLILTTEFHLTVEENPSKIILPIIPIAPIKQENQENSENSPCFKYGKINPEILQLYNYLILWATGYPKLENLIFNSEILTQKLEFKKSPKSSEFSKLLINSEPLILLCYIEKKICRTEFTKMLIKDLLNLCKNSPENRKSLLLSDYFLRWLINLQLRITSQINIAFDTLTEKLNKKVCIFISQLVCEGLWITPNIAGLLKFIKNLPFNAIAKNLDKSHINSAISTTNLLWESILDGYAELLGTHRPINSKLTLYQNMPMFVYLSIKLILSQNERDLEDSNKSIEITFGIRRLFDILSFLYAEELQIFSGTEEISDLLIIVQDLITKCTAECKKSKFYDILLILLMDFKDINKIDAKNEKTEIGNIYLSLSLLFSNAIQYSKNTSDLNFWIKKAVISVNFLLFMCEYSKIINESNFIKNIPHISIIQIISNMLRSAILYKQKENPEFAKIIFSGLASIFQFLLILRNTGRDAYAAKFIKIYLQNSMNNSKISFQTLADLCKNSEENLEKFSNEITVFYKNDTQLQKLAGTFDSMVETLIKDQKLYSNEFVSKTASDKLLRKNLINSLLFDISQSYKKTLQNTTQFFNNFVLKNQFILFKYEKHWRNMQSKLKTYYGNYRDYKLFSDTSKYQKISNHLFANGCRCLLKLRKYQYKYLDISQIKNCKALKENPDLLLLQKIHFCDFEQHKENIINPLIFITSSDDSINKISWILYNEINKADLTVKPVNCEKYGNLCIKQGKFLIYLKNSISHKGYIYFIYKYNENNDEDEFRVSFKMPINCTRLYNIKKYKLSELKSVFRKYIVENKTGLELMFINGKSVLFSFSKESECEEICKKLFAMRDTFCKNYKNQYTMINDIAKICEKSKIYESWISHRISTFDYLLYLNNLSSRSFHNLSQYPIFPWTFCDFSSEILNLQNNDFYRDLTKNIGMAGDKIRADECIEKIKREDLTGQGQFNFGSHYSFPGLIFQYLLRIRPIFEAHVKFFNGLDSPNRMFHSIGNAYNNCMKNQGDFRELIPEFYSLPEFLINTEKIDYGIREINNEKIPVDNVILPKWANNNPYVYIENMRKSLESEYVSKNLSKWIDLIFGYQSRGLEAEKVHNIYPKLCYDPEKILPKISDPETLKDSIIQAYDYGQVPKQLFLYKHPTRIYRGNDKIYTIFDSKAFPRPFTTIINKNEIESKEILNDAVIYIKIVSESAHRTEFIMITESGKIIFSTVEKIEVQPLENMPTEAKSGKISMSASQSDCRIYKNPYQTIYSSNPLRKKSHYYPILITCIRKPQYILQGVYGDLLITPLNELEHQFTIKLSGKHDTEITYLAIDRQEKILIAAGALGEILTFELNDDFKIIQKDYFFAHTAKINWTNISDPMQLFATCSDDYYINLYTLSYKPELIRVIKNPTNSPFDNVFFAGFLKIKRLFCQNSLWLVFAHLQMKNIHFIRIALMVLY